VIPDALFEIRSTRGSGTFGLEVDRTVPAPQAFVRRLLSYDAVGGRGYGASEFVLLIAGSDKGWLERYRLRVAEHPLRVSVWFGILSEIQAKGAHATWRSLRGAVAPSLQALLAVRKGKEGESINAAQG
jgi:hypothetical protein